MNLTVRYLPFTPRQQVFLHAWDQNGLVCHVEGERAPDGRSFRFTLSGTTADQRDVSFKYQFGPGEWESDDFIRTVPTRVATELWNFDFSPRCLTTDPGLASELPRVTVHAISGQRFRGGQLYLWLPGTDRAMRISESARDEESRISTFVVLLEDGLRNGFHCKLVGAGEDRRFTDFEPDHSNRVWRPSDGGEVWIKSGQVDVRSQAISLLPVDIDFVYPPAIGTPLLQIRDLVDDYQDTLNPTPPVALSAEFAHSTYTVTVFPGAIYELWWSTEPRQTARRFRIPQEQAVGPSIAVHGYDQWLDSLPAADSTVHLTVHPNPGSTFDGTVDVQVGIGTAPAHQVAVAVTQADQTWTVTLNTLSGVPFWLALVGESRPDGPLDFRRVFRTESGAAFNMHTVDGIGGFATAPLHSFEDAPSALRRQLMESVYGRDLVAAEIFDSWEMPHGTSTAGTQTYFVLRAPHALQVQLLLMTTPQRAGHPRAVEQVPMRLTDDLRYWWTAVPSAKAAHGTHYRFACQDGRELLAPEAKLGEVVDPAARWAHDQGKLIVNAGTGLEQSWARVVDLDRLRRPLLGSPWRTMGWDSLLIYEMHVRRFTQRNQENGAVLGDFDQVIRELGGGYLARLPVTALELLPLHEFPGNQSWGYNPSLFFAVDSDYGGPEPFARFVRASHDHGRAVLLDVVFNHMMESPLQVLARDVYVSGETAWGDMVHYAHPAACEFFRQALVYLWHTFRLDGFRFDSTETIINGHRDDTDSARYILARGPDGKLKVGAGRGWEFLALLRHALRSAADATGEPWPYLVGENDPENPGMTDPGRGVLDGQWHFQEMYALSGSAYNRDDKAGDVRAGLDSLANPFARSVSYAESHDSVSGQNNQQRMVRREATGAGRQMAKAVGAVVLMAKGIPMLFMGEEAAEDRPFAFDMLATDPEFVLRLDDYEQPGTEFARVLAWFQHLMGLRNNPNNGLRGDDQPATGQGRKTVALTRANGRFFLAATFGTPDQQQTLGWLGLPGGAAYKEIFNSSWPDYQVNQEPLITNGGYDARLSAEGLIHLPAIGAIVLQRV